MTKFTTTAALLAATALTAAPLAAQDEQADMTTPIQDAEVVPLTQWTYDDLYEQGVSAEAFIDDMEVYSPNGEQIGDMEDIILSPEGDVIAIVAEVGGFWDIGDTHVSVPFEEVEMTEDGEGITVPVTEENVEDYDFAADTFDPQAMSDETMPGVDDAMFAPRAWRASELIGDYARLRDGDTFMNYGYVSDLVLSEGQVEAVVVQPTGAYGGVGYRAYPYYGYADGAGWTAGSPYYDMPYREQDVEDMQRFDYGDFTS
jgi:sporulation protein YlmC with PRC-barrel domain